MSLELIMALDRVAIQSSVKAGTVLFRSGDPVSAVFLTRRGRLAFEWTVTNGVIQLEFTGPGHIAGLPAALNGTYSVTARAADDCDLGFIPTAWVIELLERDSDLSKAASELVAQEAVRMRSMMVNAFNEGNLGAAARRML